MTTKTERTDAERNAATDPRIPMRQVRLHFVNPRCDYVTSFPGTRDEIANHFCGAPQDVFNADRMVVQRVPHRIDFLPVNEGEAEISYTLPSYKQRLYRQYVIESDGYGYSFAHVDFEGAEDSTDGRYGYCMSLEDCKDVIDEQIADAEWTEEVDGAPRTLTLSFIVCEDLPSERALQYRELVIRALREFNLNSDASAEDQGMIHRMFFDYERVTDHG